MIPLIRNEYDDPVSLLIHEATDAWIPPHIDKYGTTGKNRTEQSVREKAIQKGHSTPAMAGEFAHDIKAQLLILNHIGSRSVIPFSCITLDILKTRIYAQISRTFFRAQVCRGVVPPQLHAGARTPGQHDLAASSRGICDRCLRLLVPRHTPQPTHI